MRKYRIHRDPVSELPMSPMPLDVFELIAARQLCSDACPREPAFHVAGCRAPVIAMAFREKQRGRDSLWRRLVELERSCPDDRTSEREWLCDLFGVEK